MKKLLVVLFVLIASISFGQRTITDTIYYGETVSFEAMQGAKSVTMTSSKLGDSLVGTISLYGSVDAANWVFLSYVGQVQGVASPVASLVGADLNKLTLADALVGSWHITDNFPYHKLVGVGTAASDSTLVVIKWTK